MQRIRHILDLYENMQMSKVFKKAKKKKKDS